MAIEGTNTTGIESALRVGTQNISSQFQALITALTSVFPQVSAITTGTFTCAAATSTTVSEPLTAANSFIALMPTNAAAANLMAGTGSLYISARTASTSFVVHPASGSAAGTETFQYLLVNI